MKYIEQLTTELPRDGGFLTVEVKGCVSYYIDTKYGADADGDRGYKSTVVDDVTNIEVVDLDANVVTLTQEEENFIADKLVRQFLGE